MLTQAVIGCHHLFLKRYKKAGMRGGDAILTGLWQKVADKISRVPWLCQVFVSWLCQVYSSFYPIVTPPCLYQIWTMIIESEDHSCVKRRHMRGVSNSVYKLTGKYCRSKGRRWIPWIFLLQKSKKKISKTTQSKKGLCSISINRRRRDLVNILITKIWPLAPPVIRGQLWGSLPKLLRLGISIVI